MIVIQNPCSENWNKMNKTEKGRFCESCNHIVIDFTKMTNEKIESYFEVNKSNNICGNYKKSQVYVPKETYSFKSKLLRLNFKPLNLILLLMSFFVSSCIMGKQNTQVFRAKKIEKDSLQNKSNTNIPKKDSLQNK